MTLGERILILRRRLRLTQQELARRAGLNPNTIARLEQGVLHDLRGQTLARLAEVLGTSTDYLLGRTDESGVDRRREPADVALVGAYDHVGSPTHPDEDV
jgi:transcriptional regulator with XRE-family HTH domain